jgi:hypothetical protein
LVAAEKVVIGLSVVEGVVDLDLLFFFVVVLGLIVTRLNHFGRREVGML